NINKYQAETIKWCDRKVRLKNIKPGHLVLQRVANPDTVRKCPVGQVFLHQVPSADLFSHHPEFYCGQLAWNLVKIPLKHKKENQCNTKNNLTIHQAFESTKHMSGNMVTDKPNRDTKHQEERHQHRQGKKEGKPDLQMMQDQSFAKFDINTNDAPVQKACSQMMKNAIRQQRYRLKKKFFDPFPLHLVTKTSPIRSMSNEEWNDRNKDNRSKVKFHQTTGSHSYMVHDGNL
ncbi:hypothetical protein ACJX0J_020588, partial [Zea mays]